MHDNLCDMIKQYENKDEKYFMDINAFLNTRKVNYQFPS